MKECIVVLVATQNEDEAARIATALVAKKLAACCNIIKGARSIYSWKGAVHDEHEALMFIKTRRELFSALEAEVKRLHSYSTPEIIALPVVAGSDAYLSWVEKSTI
jgi:periplasmic divalent cation tolerance protein